MSDFKWFNPKTWWGSKERAEIKRLQNKVDELEAKLAAPKKPYMNLYFAGNNLTVILNDGTAVMKSDATIELVTALKNAISEQEVNRLLGMGVEVLTIEEENRPKYSNKKVVDETAEESAEVRQHIGVLENHQDFETKDGKVFLKGVNLELPALVLGSFIELVERMSGPNTESVHKENVERYEALKMFWCWLALNPIENARRDAINFIRTNKITINKNGLLVMYRRVVTVKDSDVKYTEFVSASYLKVKKAKKGVKNYWVYYHGEDGYVLKNYANLEEDDAMYTNKGNLAELYEKLGEEEGNVFTDAHTRSKTIKVGEVYKEDEEKIDLDNRRDCSSGLHVGSESFGFGGFGDVGVVALVNPMYIRSVPVGYTNKMRVSEMFIAGIMELSEYKENIDSQELMDYSDGYCSAAIEDLKEKLKDKKFSGLVVQDQKTPIKTTDVKLVVKSLTDRVKKLV